MRLPNLPWIALAWLAFAACDSSPTEATVLSRVVVGTIDAGGTLDEVLSTPASVFTDEVFTVTVTTFGNSCVTPAGAEVSVQGRVATITPYDQRWYGGCFADLIGHPRPVSVIFREAGEALIRVRGRRGDKDMVTVERQVTVTDRP